MKQRVQVADRPILMNASMVLATLADLKTHTRRVIAEADMGGGHQADAVYPARESGWIAWSGVFQPGPELEAFTKRQYEHGFRCPYGTPGDRLWVRETFALVPEPAFRASTGVQQTLNPNDPSQAMVYRAGWDRSPPTRWRPSLHMWRWGCRLELEVVAVGVDRVQNITEEDALKEGIRAWTKDNQLVKYAPYNHAGTGPLWPWSDCPTSARAAFQRFWDEINGRGAWDRNEWVWVIEFKRRKISRHDNDEIRAAAARAVCA